MATTAIAAENEQLVREYVTEIWQQHDFERVPEFVADSIVYTEPTLSTPVRGQRAFVDHLRETETSFPDFHVSLETIVADDGVAMGEWTFRGTHGGPLDGIPPTGRQVAIRGMSILRIDGGKIVADRAYWDTGDVVTQLGLDFPAIVPQLPKLAWGKVTDRR